MRTRFSCSALVGAFKIPLSVAVAIHHAPVWNGKALRIMDSAKFVSAVSSGTNLFRLHFMVVHKTVFEAVAMW
jgi:hypothetical protein